MIFFKFPRSDVDGTLKTLSDVTFNELQSVLGDPDVKGFEEIEILGNTAYQTEIWGSIGGLKFAYLDTAIQDHEYFYRALAWTFQSQSPEAFETYKETLSSLSVQQIQSSSDQ